MPFIFWVLFLYLQGYSPTPIRSQRESCDSPPCPRPKLLKPLVTAAARHAPPRRRYDGYAQWPRGGVVPSPHPRTGDASARASRAPAPPSASPTPTPTRRGVGAAAPAASVWRAGLQLQAHGAAHPDGEARRVLQLRRRGGGSRRARGRGDHGARRRRGRGGRRRLGGQRGGGVHAGLELLPRLRRRGGHRRGREVARRDFAVGSFASGGRDVRQMLVEMPV